MVISHKDQFIFIHVHRTAGAFLMSYLRDHFGIAAEIISQHGNAQSEEGALMDEHPNYFKFAFVRNPYERLLSWYLLINKWREPSEYLNKTTFEHFLLEELREEPYFHFNQLDYLRKPGETHKMDFIGRFEQLNTDLEKLCERLKIPYHKKEALNPSKKVDYTDFYTEKAINQVAKKCADDLAYFNYSY